MIFQSIKHVLSIARLAAVGLSSRPTWLIPALILASSFLAFFPNSGRAEDPRDAKQVEAEATLSYLNRPIMVFRSTIGGMTPGQRAERAHRRLVELESSALDRPIELNPIKFAGQQGILLTIGGQTLFGIAPDDIDPEQIADVATLAEDARGRLAAAFAAQLEQERLPVLLRGFGLATAGLAVLAGLMWLIWRLRLRAGERFHALISHRMHRGAVGSIDWTRYGYALTARLVQLATTFTALLLMYVWLSFSLEQFPATEPVGQRLNAFLADLALGLASKAVDAVPGLVTVTVILLLAQALVQVTANVISAAEGGRITLPIVKPDTATATKRILRIVIWGIALAIAYPYIPGSDSAAFQGLSVLFGLMITLGSTGIVSQMMSGTVLVYSRALHAGEFVSAGDVEGVVTEMGAISTKLLTAQNEEITIPNAVLVESTIKNYSRQFGGRSAPLSTKITIGYDTPWRQVQAMLLIAASQTEGLLASPKPYVVQRALSDFYVEYELFALTNRPRDRLSIMTALHSKILDIFNEHGVQIMSPQYYEQPPQPLVVPKEKWFTAPASTDEDRKCAEAEIFRSIAAGGQGALQQMPRMGAAELASNDTRIAQ